MASRCAIVPAALLALLSAAPPAVPAETRPSEEEIGSIQVYLTADEGRAQAFPEAAGFERQARAIGQETRAALGARLGRPVADDSLAVYIARDSGGALLGYAVVSEEIGKYRPITFLVAVTPDLAVKEVAVLVYRESRGAEVHRQRFLRQYRGKTDADPIRINRDIVNITGATLSVRALNSGVKKVLALVEWYLGLS